jgi:hypothetical protein
MNTLDNAVNQTSQSPDSTEEAVTQENELTVSDVTSVATVEGVVQHTIAVPNPSKEEMERLLENIKVNYDAKVDIKPVQFNFKKTTDKDTGIETIRQAVQIPLPYPSVEGIVAILEAGGLQLDLLQEAIYKVVNDASRDILYDDVTISAATFPLDLVTWDAISKQPKAQRRGGGIAKETWEGFAQDYVNVMPSITGKTVEQIANAAKILLGKLAQVKTNEPVLKLLVGQLAIYAESSENVVEYQECVEFLLTKADTFLNVTDEQLLANL